MVLSVVSQFLVLAFAGLLVWAAVCDGRNYLIPNRIPAMIAGLWVAYGAAMLIMGVPVGNLVASIGLGAAALAIGIVLFAFRFLGGGDVKLLAASALWAGPDLVLYMLAVTAITGGVLAIGLLFGRLIRILVAEPWPAGAATIPFMGGAVRMALKSSIPFGMAIALGGLYVASQLFFGAPLAAGLTLS